MLSDNQHQQIKLALARAYRPQNFNQVAGQQHVISILQNAHANSSMHHAYLLEGTRGVGKTTIARILSMLYNCTNIKKHEPCLKCDSCLSILKSANPDIIEIDAATHTQVDRTRELLESAAYAPVSGKIKVLIIDEVHMLSQSSFAAMLKTLEEPPPHLRFILATTHPQKIPVTILSRTLRLSLRPLTNQQIYDHLLDVLNKEKINFEPDAIQEVARLAHGSLRDSLSLLEQIIALSPDKLGLEQVRQATGDFGFFHLQPLFNALANRDAKKIDEICRKCEHEGVDFTICLENMAEIAFYASLNQHSINADQQNSGASAQLSAHVADLYSANELQLMYDLLLQAKTQLHQAPSELIGFEMIMLRIALFTAVNLVQAKNQETPLKPQKATISPTPTPIDNQPAELTDNSTNNPTSTSTPDSTTNASSIEAINQAQPTPDYQTKKKTKLDNQRPVHLAAQIAKQIMQAAPLAATNWYKYCNELSGTGKFYARDLECRTFTDEHISLAAKDLDQTTKRHLSLLAQLQEHYPQAQIDFISLDSEKTNHSPNDIDDKITQAQRQEHQNHLQDNHFVKTIKKTFPEAKVTPHPIKSQ